MAQIKPITVSYETAKELKDAGWDKETLFAYNLLGELFIKSQFQKGRYCKECKRKPGETYFVFNSISKLIPAPTGIEAWNELPNSMNVDDDWGYYEKCKLSCGTIVYAPVGLGGEILISNAKYSAINVFVMWMRGKEGGWTE